MKPRRLERLKFIGLSSDQIPQIAHLVRVSGHLEPAFAVAVALRLMNTSMLLFRESLNGRDVVRPQRLYLTAL